MHKRKLINPPRREPQAASRRTIDAILQQRELLVATVAELHKQGRASKFAENAQELLTRWWAASNWKARQELLKSADWLIKLEQRRGNEAISEAMSSGT